MSENTTIEEFRSKMVQVSAGAAAMLSPVEFGGRVSEAQLEQWLLRDPELAGEPLLVLGSQLAEFAEDKDRLDVLAVDRNGELVLLELKVDGAFRLTDLQAMAYAAGYASLPPSHLADVLRKRLEKESGETKSLEEAKAIIGSFIDIVDEFEEWAPSRRVRIKAGRPRLSEACAEHGEVARRRLRDADRGDPVSAVRGREREAEPDLRAAAPAQE